MIIKPSNEDGPCCGKIIFNIFIHSMLPDGSLDPEVLDCSDEFNDCSASPIGEIFVSGVNKRECVKEIKKILERLINEL